MVSSENFSAENGVFAAPRFGYIIGINGNVVTEVLRINPEISSPIPPKNTIIAMENHHVLLGNTSTQMIGFPASHLRSFRGCRYPTFRQNLKPQITPFYLPSSWLSIRKQIITSLYHFLVFMLGTYPPWKGNRFRNDSRLFFHALIVAPMLHTVWYK